MRRNFLTRFLVCLAPTALAALFVGLAVDRQSAGRAGFRRGIDLAGGTILVYEVDLGKSQAPGGGAAADGLSGDELRRLADNLKRRIDPADLRNVVVRPVGDRRVEIILPFAAAPGGDAGANEEFVREVRALVAQTGVLEFRILANPTDDDKAVRDAQALIAQADTDPRAKQELADRARRGDPPPAPPDTYAVAINGVDEDGVRYEWAELGKEERESLGLSNPGPDKPATDLWQRLQAARGKTAAGPLGMLLYSREHAEVNPPRDEAGKKVEYFVLTRISPSDSLRLGKQPNGDDVKLTARAGTNDRTLSPAVDFEFNAAGARRFGRISDRNRKDENFKRVLAILMDGRVVSAPTLDGRITDRGQISGNFDAGTVNRMVYILRSGALNAALKPEPVSENTVGATLGADTIRKGVTSVGLAFAAVMLFMVGYYKFAGLVACLALLANLLLTVGFMVAVNAAFTLPGLAGIVLMLGMAVDANVLIYERMREERDKGANLAAAVRLGYDRALPTILDTHLTSIFTAVVLYTFGNDNLKGFAVSLTIGLLISLFTSLYMTRLAFDYWMHRRWMTRFTPHQLFRRPAIDFMRLRVPMFGLTTVLTALGLGLFLARGEAALNVDFTKGTAYGGRLADPLPLTGTADRPGLLDLLSEARQRDRLAVAEVVWRGRPADDGDAADRRPDWIYDVTYAGGERATVTLSAPPAGATADEQVADVAARASRLPDHSVEQVRLSGADDDLPAGVSRSFTVRTTEKEPELVQVMLDRLLRGPDGKPLLATTRRTGTEVKGPTATLTFDKPTAPGYLRGFLVRELKLENRVPATGSSPAVVVTGVPAAGDGPEADAARAAEAKTGRFATVRVDVGPNPEFAALKAAADAGKGPEAGSAAAEDARAFRAAVDRAVAAFEARPLPDRLETFDPALAADTRNKALYAIALSWAAILVYLWLRFGSWAFGLSAVACLVHDLCFTLGAVAVCHYLHGTAVGQVLGLQDFKIDLASVAALLTLVGYSVSDTIVVFDRIKEVRGKNPRLTPQMINDSVNQALGRTVLASLTVFLVVGVLYWFGGEGVHLFAFVMVVGVVVGTFSSIYVASPLLLMFGEGAAKPTDKPAAAPAPAEITA